MKPVQNGTPVPITWALNYNQSTGGHLAREHGSGFSPYNPLHVSFDGITCILFWANGITVTFQNQTWLDLTDGAFGHKATVDTQSSNCSEESATLSLKFGDTENATALALRFILTNHEPPGRSWFSLHRVEITLNGTVRASFSAASVHAPAGLSYRCPHVGSLRRGALLRPAGPRDSAGPWALTLLDLQIQGFAIQGRQFAKARDCTSSSSSSSSLAVLIGLAMSLILLLVLAYALHMLIYLRSLDRHYEFITTSPAHLSQLWAPGATTTEEKGLLQSHGQESYELQDQRICKIYV